MKIMTWTCRRKIIPGEKEIGQQHRGRKAQGVGKTACSRAPYFFGGSLNSDPKAVSMTDTVCIHGSAPPPRHPTITAATLPLFPRDVHMPPNTAVSRIANTDGLLEQKVIHPLGGGTSFRAVLFKLCSALECFVQMKPYLEA